jgi:enamine deaminase RidA (YjgF/YER057c/UK114 family)
MARQIITTPNAPSSPLYSQGVKAGPHVLVSGIVGIDPSSGSLAGDTIQDQTRQALTNCEAILRAGGASLDDVIEVGVLLTHPADFAGLNEEYARWLRCQAWRRTARTARLDPDDSIPHMKIPRRRSPV